MATQLLFNWGSIFVSYIFKSLATFMCCINTRVGLKVNAEIRIMLVTCTWKMLHWVSNLYLTDLPCHWQQRPSLCKHFLSMFWTVRRSLQKPPTVLPAHRESIEIPTGRDNEALSYVTIVLCHPFDNGFLFIVKLFLYKPSFPKLSMEVWHCPSVSNLCNSYLGKCVSIFLVWQFI